MSPVTNQICGPQAGVPSKPVFGLLEQEALACAEESFGLCGSIPRDYGDAGD
jgi:hypothetical protein